MTLQPLPDIKQQFKLECYEPVRKELQPFNASMEVAFEKAKELYEGRHGHKFPYTYKTFERFIYEGK